MSNTENFKNKENLKQIDWVDSEIKAELSALWQNVDSFYEVKQDSIEFKEDVVKQYLVKLRDEVKDMETKAAWQHLASKENNSAWIMAVQIALEKLWYEVGKIDWVLWKETRNGVLRFQTQCDLWGKDGFPGKETITKLCEALDNPDQFAAKSESKPVTWSASDSSTSTESSWVSGWGEQSSQSSAWSTVVEQQKVSEWNEYIITVNGKKCRLLSLDSIENLSKEYTRKDPENYDASKKETYPRVYQFKWDGGFYTFYSNGRCMLPDWSMNNTKVIVEKLKRWFASEKKYWNVELNLHMNTISSLLEWTEVLIDGKKDSIWSVMYGSNVRFYLKGWKHTNTKISQGNYVWQQKKETSTSYDYYIDLWAGELLDASWNFDRNYFKNVIIQKIKNNLESQHKAESVMDWLYKLSKKWYSITDIFGEEKSDDTAYLKYFNEMDGRTKKITFRKNSFKRDWTNIKFDLDQDGDQESYNRLTVDYKELADSNGNFSEDRLKAYLKKKVTEIVEKYFK